MMDSSWSFILRDDASAPRIPNPLFIWYVASKETIGLRHLYLRAILEQTQRTCVWEGIHCFGTEQDGTQHATSFPGFSPTLPTERGRDPSERSTSSTGSCKARRPWGRGSRTFDLARASTWVYFDKNTFRSPLGSLATNFLPICPSLESFVCHHKYSGIHVTRPRKGLSNLGTRVLNMASRFVTGLEDKCAVYR